MKIFTKRAYDAAKPADGYRVLVDRVWPRGLRVHDLVRAAGVDRNVRAASASGTQVTAG